MFTKRLYVLALSIIEVETTCAITSHQEALRRLDHLKLYSCKNIGFVLAYHNIHDQIHFINLKKESLNTSNVYKLATVFN